MWARRTRQGCTVAGTDQPLETASEARVPGPRTLPLPLPSPVTLACLSPSGLSSLTCQQLKLLLKDVKGLNAVVKKQKPLEQFSDDRR